jgi:hypothetical protein
MTASTDFDRAIREWLEAGVTRAPDAAIEAALDHARRHPRRRDLLLRFRRDPMPARPRAAVGTPVLVLVALGLVMAAVVGFGIVGGRGPADIAPTPSSTPTPSPSPEPTATPTGVPPLSPITVPIETGTAAAIRVTVEDASGSLVTARSGAPADGGSVEPGVVRVENEDPTTLRLTWTEAVCSIDYRLVIDVTGRAMTLEQPPCSGDAMALDRVLVLVFDGPIEATEVAIAVVDVDQAG